MLFIEVCLAGLGVSVLEMGLASIVLFESGLVVVFSGFLESCGNLEMEKDYKFTITGKSGP